MKYPLLSLFVLALFACDGDEPSTSASNKDGSTNKPGAGAPEAQGQGRFKESDFDEKDIQTFDFELVADLDFTAGEPGKALALLGTIDTKNLGYRSQKDAREKDIDSAESGCALGIPAGDPPILKKQGLLAQSSLAHVFNNGTHLISIGLSQRQTFRNAFLLCKNALNSRDIEAHLGHVLRLKKK